MRPRTSLIWAMPADEFRALVARSATLTEVLAAFGLTMRGGNYKTLLRRIAEEGIDTGHLRRHRPAPPSPARELSTVLIAGAVTGTWHLRNRLVREGLLSEVCAACGLGPEWNGMPLRLHLDHINGDRADNRLENLRLLCPNCHSQTDSYAGRKMAGVRRRPPVLCARCGSPRPGSAPRGAFCRTCADEVRRKVTRPEAKILREQVAKLGYTKTGLLYGVSDNAVRKWLREA